MFCSIFETCYSLSTNGVCIFLPNIFPRHSLTSLSVESDPVGSGPRNELPPPPSGGDINALWKAAEDALEEEALDANKDDRADDIGLIKLPNEP